MSDITQTTITARKVSGGAVSFKSGDTEVFVLPPTKDEPAIVRVSSKGSYKCATSESEWDKIVRQINIPNTPPALRLEWSPADGQPVQLTAPAKLLETVKCVDDSVIGRS